MRHAMRHVETHVRETAGMVPSPRRNRGWRREGPRRETEEIAGVALRRVVESRADRGCMEGGGSGEGTCAAEE